MNLRTLAKRVDQARDDGDKWCPIEKAHALAAIVFASRPALVVEIGVWRGASLIPQLLAQQINGVGRAIAIDPWDKVASVADQEQVHVDWWSTVDHEAAYQQFLTRMRGLGVVQLCDVWRKRSDDCTPPDGIGVLHIDGNHSDQAIRDVERFAPKVSNGGGWLVMDDVGWVGGGVSRAVGLAKQLGFVERYPIGTGLVLQRT